MSWTDELYDLRQYYAALCLTFIEDAETGSPETKAEIREWLQNPEYREILREWALFANNHPELYLKKLDKLFA